MKSTRDNFGYVVAWVKFDKNGQVEEYHAWEIESMRKAKALYWFVLIFFRPNRIALRKPKSDLTIKKHERE
jgi:hypothetical protein